MRTPRSFTRSRNWVRKACRPLERISSIAPYCSSARSRPARRSVSGFEIYRKVYRDVIRPERVADLLILRPDMPRSLHASMNEVVANLAMVGSDTLSETQRRAGRLRAELQYGHIEEILANGLHAFLTQFLDRVNDLGVRISRDFLIPA